VKTRGTHHGTPTYYAWYEMYPGAAHLLGANYPVAPGQLISASVTLSGSTYTLTLSNGIWHDSISQPFSGQQNASAEWITEAPTNCRSTGCAVVQLSNFGLLSFTNAKADGQAISSSTFTSTQIDMTNRSGKKLRAKTSGLISAGNAFNVTWIHK